MTEIKLIKLKGDFSGEFWALDDGDGPPLIHCPCCGQWMSLAAAETVKKKVDEETLTMRALREMDRLLWPSQS